MSAWWEKVRLVFIKQAGTKPCASEEYNSFKFWLVLIMRRIFVLFCLVGIIENYWKWCFGCTINPKNCNCPFTSKTKLHSPVSDYDCMTMWLILSWGYFHNATLQHTILNYITNISQNDAMLKTIYSHMIS